MWMVITQVVSVGPVFKSVVAVATVPPLVLPLHKENNVVQATPQIQSMPKLTP